MCTSWPGWAMNRKKKQHHQNRNATRNVLVTVAVQLELLLSAQNIIKSSPMYTHSCPIQTNLVPRALPQSTKCCNTGSGNARIFTSGELQQMLHDKNINATSEERHRSGIAARGLSLDIEPQLSQSAMRTVLMNTAQNSIAYIDKPIRFCSLNISCRS